MEHYLGSDFINISAYSLGATHLIVFARVILTPIISKIESDHVSTGISGVIGNKGAVSVSFNLGMTRVLFISSHLAAGHDKIEKRNEDWKTIYRALVLR